MSWGKEKRMLWNIMLLTENKDCFKKEVWNNSRRTMESGDNNFSSKENINYHTDYKYL